MKALLTGANGTIGMALRKLLNQNHIEVIGWNRDEVPVDDYQRMEDFVRETQPDFLFHLAFASKLTGIENETWKINYEWPGELAWITRKLKVKFVFTSTNLVFSNRQSGPFDTTSKPDAESGYGYEKRMAEERVRSQNPDALIARLGWQIGHAAGSNNMIDYLQRQMDDNGIIRANVNWKPACSFLADTCSQLIDLAADCPPSLYQLDANEHWNFFEIATALNKLHGNPWKVEAVSGEIMDNRMTDARLQLPSLINYLDLP
ncbi:MAG: sugar nucleotide-binding protein [Chitinophagaceae bacterium]|nr:sugar nucleotide-binding protein [Chitinophagaceae bacterium]